MRIAVDCRTILDPVAGEGAGVGHYTSAILRGILSQDQENEYILFFGEKGNERVLFDMFGEKTNVRLKPFPLYSSRRYFPLAYSQAMISLAIAQSKPDVYFAPSGLTPIFYKGPTVITTHDLAIFRHPEWFPESRLVRKYSTGLLVPRSMRNSNAVIAPSQATAHDIKIFFQYARDKVKVIPHGVNHRCADEYVLDNATRDRFQIKDKYFLTLCTIEPRKNIETAVRAFDRWLIKNPSLAKRYSFVIAGKKGWKYEHIFDVINEVNRRWRNYHGHNVVQYLGYVSQKEKWELLVNAHAFIYPSKYEGFGLPVLEAMSVRTPVITSRTTSLPEVGGEAVLYINPDDPGPVVQLFDRLLDDNYRTNLAEKGYQRSLEFDWQKASQKTLEVLSRVGSGSR
jgi:glycosyltransferase involved in cell wall biosynthesis